jgi:hypothetical protein
MPSLSTSNGKESITLTLSEVRKIFEAVYIIRGVERYLGGAKEGVETNERKFQELAMKLCKEYGSQHLDSAGYPKETPKQKASNAL